MWHLLFWCADSFSSIISAPSMCISQAHAFLDYDYESRRVNQNTRMVQCRERSSSLRSSTCCKSSGINFSYSIQANFNCVGSFFPESIKFKHRTDVLGVLTRFNLPKCSINHICSRVPSVTGVCTLVN